MITRVAHVGLRVTDLESAVRFTTDILGLRESARVDGASYLTCNEKHHELVLIQADEPGADHLALEVRTGRELEDLRTRLEQEGVAFESHEPREPGLESAFRVVGPGGHVLELFSGMSADEPTDYNTVGVRPLKFSHVFIKAEDTGAMEDFLTRIFGFRVSSRSGDIAWLRCNPEHHAVALAPGRNQLHHAAWEVDGWGTIEQLGDHLRRNGLGLWFGPGRHGPGNSIFAYFFGPDRFIFEYAAEFQRIGNEAAWETEIWPDEPLTVNPWGPAPPDDFLEHGVDVVQRATTLSRS